MKFKEIIILATLSVFISCQNGNTDIAIPQDQKIEQAIRKHLKEMTLEEKIGQMTQINITEIRGKDYMLDEEKADRILRQYKV